QCQQSIDERAHLARAALNLLQMDLWLTGIGCAAILTQHLHMRMNEPQRRPQIVRHGIRKGFQLPIGNFQLRGALGDPALQFSIQAFDRTGIRAPAVIQMCHSFHPVTLLRTSRSGRGAYWPGIRAGKTGSLDVTPSALHYNRIKMHRDMQSLAHVPREQPPATGRAYQSPSAARSAVNSSAQSSSTMMHLSLSSPSRQKAFTPC